MHIKDKINLDYDGLIKEGPITIVAFGDSVTHGAIAAGENDYETVYWNRLKKKIYQVRDYVPVNVINVGIGGITAEYQNGGRMDTYINSAVELAKEMGVPVCDCYAKWKTLSKTRDTTMLPANHINHPTREMHELFAQSLFEMIFEGDNGCVASDETMMYTE